MKADYLNYSDYPNIQTPCSFLNCLPWIWNTILFPGKSSQSTALRWQALLWLLLLPGAVLYPCLGFYLFEPDEGRYAQIPAEMLARGDWVVPHLQSEPYLDKPPLLYWLVMISYSIFGTHDWSARLVPALAMQGCILLVYLIGRKSLGERIAFWGAMTLFLMPAFVGIGRLLLLDGVLTFFTTLAILSLFEAVRKQRLKWGWWILGAAACGFGILCKGPVILILVIPPVALHRWLTRPANLHRRMDGPVRPDAGRMDSPVRPGSPTGKTAHPAVLGWPALVSFMFVCCVIALPWYIAICYRLPEFGYYFLWKHNVLRFFQPFDHIQPVWYYVPILLPCLLPASLLLIPFIRFVFTGDAALSTKRTPVLGFMLMAGCWCVLFFSLSGCKLPTYILPAFPPLAICFGIFLAESKWRNSRWVSSSAVFSYAVMVVGHFVLAPWYADYRSPLDESKTVLQWCQDRSVPVVCYPRNVDSVAFYTGRNDFQTYRSKYTPQMLEYIATQEKVVVLFGHRHSKEQLRNLLPPHMVMSKTAPMGLCAMAIVERRKEHHRGIKEPATGSAVGLHKAASSQ